MNRILAILFCCVTVSCTTKQEPLNKFADAIFAKIADYQDRRQSDSLYQFFNHENPVYRKNAVLAFASIQDTLAIGKLTEVLKNDSDLNVRSEAAFALGQTGTLKSFEALIEALSTEKSEPVLREIIEGCGKTSTKENALKLVKQTESGLNDDFAWLYYRLGLRGLADSSVVARSITFLDSTETLETRTGAAHFFARGPKEISLAETELQKAALTDQSPFVRMAAALALRKINSSSSLNALKTIIDKDEDYRVRANAVRALQTFATPDIKQNLFVALNDPNQHVGVTASEVIKAIATKDEFTELVPLARAATNWRIQGNLFEAALAVSNNKEIAEEVIRLYEKVENPYGKAALINALGQSTLAYNFISQQLYQSQVAVIKSSAATALFSINGHKEFNTEMQKDFVDIYKKAFETGDPAVIGIISAALGDSTLGYKRIIKDYSFLYTAKSKLSLPKDNEALQPLEAAIAHFEGKKISEEVKNEFNHPIDWSLVKTIPKDQKVLIKTVKGDIVIQLLVEEAPGSVANFVQLVNSQYFNAKNFHRVVPNFVIQGGCNRGDGWGSEDYSIRSEFSMRRYTEGSVGMASAGKDTEGTQWFITHSPTPHLDGRYTIFAIVTEGMNVVHSMEVGDGIISVELVK
jgi:cyclophilin family peptidyl-prolyl cis-trans isomerase/HEAT repeat protein